MLFHKITPAQYHSLLLIVQAEKKKSVVSRGFRGGKGVVKLNAENWDSYIGLISFAVAFLSYVIA